MQSSQRSVTLQSSLIESQRTQQFYRDIPFKEDPILWTQKKLISFLVKSQKKYIDDIIEIIKKNEYTMKDLLHMDNEEQLCVFSDHLPVIEEIIEDVKKYRSDLPTDRTIQCVSGNYNFNTIKTNGDDQLSQQQNSVNSEQQSFPVLSLSAGVPTETSYVGTSSSIIHYTLTDYDSYPHLEQAMINFKEIIMHPKEKRLQDLHEKFQSNNYKICLQVKSSEGTVNYQFNQKESSNQIFSTSLQPNESVEVICQDQMLYIMDFSYSREAGSGVYIKFRNTNQIPLFKNSVFMLGETELKIKEIISHNEICFVTLVRFLGEQNQINSNKQEEFKFELKMGQTLRIGSDMNSQFSLCQLLQKDPTIKKYHAQFSFVGTTLYLKNKDENETWLRLDFYQKSKDSKPESDEKINHYQSLQHAIEVKIGKQIFQIELNKVDQNNHHTPLSDLLGQNLSSCSLCDQLVQCVSYTPCKHKEICLICFVSFLPSKCYTCQKSIHSIFQS